MGGKPGLKTFLWLTLGVGLGLSLGLLVHRETPGQRSSVSEVVVSASPTIGVPSQPPPAIVAPTNASPSMAGLQRLRNLCNDPQNVDLAECLTLVKTLSAAECREALELFRQLRGDEQRLLERAAARRWASLDGEAMLKSVFPIRNWERQSVLIEEAATALARRDPDAALATLETAPMLQRLAMGRFILSAVAERDPARAGAFLARHPEFARDDNAYRIVAGHWASTDPLGALAWANGLPGGRLRNETIKALGTAWARHDPATVAAEVSRAREQWDREVVTAVAQNWSQRDPRAAMAWIASLRIKEDQDAAWSALRLDVGQLGVDTALVILKQIPSVSVRGNVASRIASDLARQNPQEALAWAERLPEGTLRNQALRPVLDQVAAQDPVNAVSYAAALPAGNGRSELLRLAVASWAIRDADAALTWSQQLPKGPERDEVLSEAARSLRNIDPAAAARWFELTENTHVRQRLIQEVAGNWAATDGAAAAQWLSQLPDADALVQGHHAVARQWALADIEGSANWIRSLLPGANRDAAIRAFVTSVDGYDAALATTWAMAIGESKQRQESVGSAFGRWMQSDPASAQAWLTGAALEEDFRSKLAQFAEKQSRR